MPNGNNQNAILPTARCVLVKLPIVLADVRDSVTVDNVSCPPEPAKKIDHIDVVVRDLEADPVFSGPVMSGHAPCNSPKATVHFGDPVCGPRELRSITVHGTLHKQVYYVNKEDDVRHFGEDVPFTKSIKLSPPLPVSNPGNIDIEFRDVDVDVDFELPRPTRVQQVANITFTLKITEDQQIFIQTCIPDQDLVGSQVLANTGFEAFAGCVLAVWQQSNAAPGQQGRNGGFAVGLGGPPAGFLPPGSCTANPSQPASISQTIPADVIRPGLRYEFCFYISEAVPPGSVADYTVEARVAFFDAAGNTINSAAVQTFTEEQINGTWVQKCVTATAPAGAVSGLVSLVFTPEAGNGAYVLVDDATLTIRA
ncbi:DUF3794 domain-containing protein [Desulforamulus hydrothermalis]|uniref:SipL SPOCS domain-containing protein n=1 Tax=Desulforamulus hydrothermalis Lam5 = DSM 18033 TaxID=1121428 RepID=K8DZU4_9FIRM|nr:DUF3794 domain-containing protein [Desulforamulus hydrothermalis]CCO08585.1 conserved hypothetical protein [Desulforamulus hydrothermalis Lam5 = DSM 18033]SHH01678.1 hypothetical protein SAMN02745177_01138 [Desulforamulus hydrothermalis Lam5 = DSM 18033]